jgi:proline iminopeptidase
MIHGRLDLGGPLVTAWELSQAWSDAELIVVNSAGHSTGDPGMTETVVAATDRFAASP